MKYLFLTISVALLEFGATSTPALAAENKKWAFLQAGGFATTISRPASTPQGNNSTMIGRTYAAVGLAFEFGQSRWHFAPAVQFTPLGTPTDDDSATYYLLKISLTPAYHLVGPFDLRLGPGVLYQFMYGHGGTATLNNGTGTSTFFKPARNTAMRQVFLETALDIAFSDKIRLDLEIFATGLLSAQRSFDLGAFLSWGIF